MCHDVGKSLVQGLFPRRDMHTASTVISQYIHDNINIIIIIIIIVIRHTDPLTI